MRWIRTWLWGWIGGRANLRAVARGARWSALLLATLVARPGPALGQRPAKGKASVPSPAEAGPAWRRDSIESRMGDPTLYFIAATSPDSFHGPDGAGRVELDVTCGPRVHLISPAVLDADYSGGTPSVKVRVRLDEQSPQEEVWLVGRSALAAFPAGGTWEYVGKFRRHLTLLIEIPIYRAGPQVFKFPLEGYADALDWLAQSCGVR